MPPLRPFAIALVVALPVSLSVAATAAAPAMLAAVPAQVASVQGRSGFDGVVEAVRQDRGRRPGQRRRGRAGREGGRPGAGGIYRSPAGTD